MNFPSKLIEDAVNEFSRLPGIGKKTALRLVLHLLKQPEEKVNRFGEAVLRMRREIKYCKVCNNVSDTEICNICSNTARDSSLVCVVENLRDVVAIEGTQQYHGLYHVLGGVISPVEGIGPEELTIDKLMERVEKGEVRELVMALSPTMEGDTTIFYISKKVKAYDVKVSTIARGVSFGGDLEYTDELTLARSIVNRLPFENYLSDR